MTRVKTFKIASIPGDGIGPEVMAEAHKLLERISELDPEVSFEIDTFPWGCEYYLEKGEMMPENGLEILAGYDAILLGAIGFPGVPDHVSLHGLLLKIRKGFDQYIGFRPIKLLPGAPRVLVGKGPEDIDMIFIRENTEGEYAGVGGRMYEGTPRELALQTGVFTRAGIERVQRYAFELARSTGRPLTSITKSNALNYSMVLWDEIFTELVKEYPEVETNSLLVDAAAMFMVRSPERFGVLVASNLFADILTDLGAALQGGLGFAAGANINPEGKHPSMFEPIHGSAPDIAGKGISNPIASLWTAKLMLDHLGLTNWGERVLAAISKVVSEGQVATPDMGGKATTSEVGEAVRNAL
ncbi:MAG: tartrate dehydrogenase [Firmicutes bacterium]|nr:tartrate dehydrogenase [Bacillota bacterium]